MKERGDATMSAKKIAIRSTKHRREVLKAIETSSHPIAADALYLDLLQTGSDIALSTIYRVLDYLESNKAIEKTNPMDGSKAVYEIATDKHHHHMICLTCKNSYPLPLCPLESFEAQIMSKTGFKILSHRLELYGYCSDCESMHTMNNDLENALLQKITHENEFI